MARSPEKPAGSPRFVLIAVTLAGVLVLAAGVAIGFAVREMPRGAAGTVLATAIGGTFHLTDQNGKTVTEDNLKGKWQLVFFGYTHCPDACPTALNEISLALDKLGSKAKSVGVVFITVDPERDTQASIKSYLESFDAPVVGLTGTTTEIAQAAKNYRVYYAKRQRA